ncbi:MAG TPA: DegV family protein [Ktedonobacterales bacterium]|jgi:DegV family protein with EDD domain|nr:DegV family protein [Ktedonobacterales bacterium]
MRDDTRFPDWLRAIGARSPAPERGGGHVRIVTDSASDILPSHARALGAVVVPSRIVLDGAVYRDGIDITAAQFYAHLPRLRTPPHTEPAAPQEFYEAYRAALGQGATAIVSIHVSGRLSKIVEHASVAQAHLSPAAIDVIDSRQAGIGMWPAVTRAAQLARLGATLQEIHTATVSILARTRMYALVESLDQLRRVGRIGRARALLGTMLDAHPIITIERGEVMPVDTVRTWARGLQRLRELVREVGAPETLLACGASIEAIAQLEAVLAEEYTGTIEKTWLGPAIGSNTGPCVAVAVVAWH